MLEKPIWTKNSWWTYLMKRWWFLFRGEKMYHEAVPSVVFHEKFCERNLGKIDLRFPRNPITFLRLIMEPPYYAFRRHPLLILWQYDCMPRDLVFFFSKWYSHKMWNAACSFVASAWKVVFFGYSTASKSSLLPPQNASLTEGTLTHTISKHGELFIIMRLPVVYQKVLRL